MCDQSVISLPSQDALSPSFYSIAPCFEVGEQPSLLEIEPQSSILKPEVLKRLKLDLLRGKEHVTPSFTLYDHIPSLPHHQSSEHSLYAVKEEQRTNHNSRCAHIIDICSNGFEQYRLKKRPNGFEEEYPTKRPKLGRLPHPSADILHDRELAAHWIAREIVEFAQSYTIVDDEHSDEHSDDDSEADEQLVDSSDDGLPGDVPGLERPESLDSVDSFPSTDSDHLRNSINACFNQVKSIDAPSPVQRPIPLGRHPLSIFSPSLTSFQGSSAFRSLSTSFGTNSLALFAGTPSNNSSSLYPTSSLALYGGNSGSTSSSLYPTNSSTTFASALFNTSSPSLYPQWGSTSSAFTPLSSTCFTTNPVPLGTSSSGLYPRQTSGAFIVPEPPSICPSTNAASAMVSLAFST